MSAWWVDDEPPIVHPHHPLGGAQLLMQKGAYHFKEVPHRPPEAGVRFVWRLASGKLQARGPARIDGLADIDLLVSIAQSRGW